jgi:glycerol-3-phosphate dehydrogenase
MESVDLLIVGGGINGVGVARDAVGRGLSVLLCEQGDLAAGTSSASSKLIHGGLRYLEQYAFRLVREALAEREVLMSMAPHLVRPLRIVMPHDPGLRPWWQVRAGLLLYDNLSRRQRLEGSHGVRLTRSPLGEPLQPAWGRGFTYADCRTDDARLVVLSARDAADRGAQVRPHTRCVEATRAGEEWRVTLQPQPAGAAYEVRARVLVNATGPWMKDGLPTVLTPATQAVRLVKGSHLVLPALYPGDHGYILQNTDRRIVFVLPFADGFSLIGTTDVPCGGDPATVAMDDAEADYLCAVVNRYFAKAITPGDAVWRFAGIRHLADADAENPAAASREYVLPIEVGHDREGAPLLSIIGGKLTGYREVAGHVLEKLRPWLPHMGPAWSGTLPLPGGDVPHGDMALFRAGLQRQYPWLAPALAARLAGAYGTLTHTLLDGARSPAELGRDFGAGLHEREVDYLIEREWAAGADDVLWRRSKLGLRLTPAQRDALAAWMAHRAPGRAQPAPGAARLG